MMTADDLLLMEMTDAEFQRVSDVLFSLHKIRVVRKGAVMTLTDEESGAFRSMSMQNVTVAGLGRLAAYMRRCLD